jgi:hypothetical protein
MGYETLNDGILLTLPTVGTTNWGEQLKNTTWSKISGHDHTGSGNGVKLSSDALAANISFTKAPTQSPSGASPAQTLDFNLGNIQVLDLDGVTSGDVVLTLDNPQEGGLYTILVIQGASGGGIDWSSVPVLWPQGQEFIISTTDDALDKITLLYDGANFLADWNLDYK